MPVFCIAYGCDNDKRSAPKGTSFHRLPLNKSSLLKQVRIFLNRLYISTLTLIVANQPTIDPPIHDSNARVCSHHFTEQDFVSSIVEGFGPKRPTLKPEAVPTVFGFSQPAKHRKLT